MQARQGPVGSADYPKNRPMITAILMLMAIPIMLLNRARAATSCRKAAAPLALMTFVEWIFMVLTQIRLQAAKPNGCATVSSRLFCRLPRTIDCRQSTCNHTNRVKNTWILVRFSGVVAFGRLVRALHEIQSAGGFAGVLAASQVQLA